RQNETYCTSAPHSSNGHILLSRPPLPIGSPLGMCKSAPCLTPSPQAPSIQMRVVSASLPACPAPLRLFGFVVFALRVRSARLARTRPGTCPLRIFSTVAPADLQLSQGNSKAKHVSRTVLY